ncbi:conjugal transfer protein TraB [Vibrio cholerae]|uniref:TraB/VirB10 family protein n=1 Tax=Vibrio cholerae TaxID=666 RepID=UPI0011F14925|nr:TraB/VirB10 family protein [Vibrio cholerae]EHK7541299.1 TraB/VirB10 family protein [Vibrio cholerae]KAA1002983.1 conjugal transfer protein TraB [Vibrio cholerae]KAA1008625.1 conjugal transfer protein TraB [Vibrio cholerae]KAA1017251.1 conjugal transfer protein TraB [Vibrio cholerae]KAA1023745.1 conjugal transfer protein TraB [Vibrio cholerae]
MKAQWEQMSPNMKRGLSVAGIAGGLILMVMVFSPNPDDGSSSRNRQETIRHILTDTNTRDVGVDSLAANVKLLNERNEQLRREVERLRRDVDSGRLSPGSPSIPSEVNAELARLRAELDDVRAGGDLVVEGTNSRIEVPLSAMELPKDEKPLPDPLDQQPVNGQGTRTRDVPLPPITIRMIEPEVVAEPEVVVQEAPPLYLPAGSIISGTLITGLDAPTHESARREPFPALLRIQKEAILPNRFRADIKECFLIAAGYGDLSSERAYLRGETISCVREDGGVIETRLDSYAVGEDGKAGIRGRLVSKQGQLVAKSMMAGFLQGLAGAFDVNPVPTIQTGNAGDTQLYQQVMSQEALQGAAIKGTGKALDRVAKFYLDMAENMFPVIEVDAARKIEVIVTRGASLSLATSQGGGARR